MTTPIRDAHSERYAHCYGWSAANREGIDLKTSLEGDETVAGHTPRPVYTGGVAGRVYGGLMALSAGDQVCIRGEMIAIEMPADL